MLKLNSVSKQFSDGTFAVNKLSLEIPEGQICVLLGSSGAGKSTLLKMINGMIYPTSGSIEVDGIQLSPKSLKSIRFKIATIHQSFSLIPRLSVEKNIISGALGEIGFLRALFHVFPLNLRKKACELMHSVGLKEKHLNRKAAALSGGQQQRVGIARAFILSPSIVLADEPVASLDPLVSRSVLGILSNAANERKATVICSLHQVDLAKEFADRIIGIKGGEIVFDRFPKDISELDLQRLYEE